jgi:hypothetical protein
MYILNSYNNFLLKSYSLFKKHLLLWVRSTGSIRHIMSFWTITSDPYYEGMTATAVAKAPKHFFSEQDPSPSLGSKWFVPVDIHAQHRLYHLAWYIGPSLDHRDLHLFALLPPQQMVREMNKGTNISHFVVSHQLYHCRRIDRERYISHDALQQVYDMVYHTARLRAVIIG